MNLHKIATVHDTFDSLLIKFIFADQVKTISIIYIFQSVTMTNSFISKSLYKKDRKIYKDSKYSNGEHQM